jgi:hypothetical protein
MGGSKPFADHAQDAETSRIVLRTDTSAGNKDIRTDLTRASIGHSWPGPAECGNLAFGGPVNRIGEMPMRREISGAWSSKTRILALVTCFFQNTDFELVGWSFALGLLIFLYLSVAVPNFSRLVIELEENL